MHKKILALLFAAGLVFGLSACEANLQGDVSNVDIEKSCPGDETAPPGQYDNRVLVYIKPGAGQNYDILVSANGNFVAGWPNQAPGSLREWVNHTHNYTTFDVAIWPSDDSGVSDDYHQVFNPC